MKQLSLLDIKQRIETSLNKLTSWLKQSGFSGYDPYDIRGCSRYLEISRSKAFHARFAKKLFKYGEIFSPNSLRKALGIKKEKNAKAMGLFAKAYLDLYRTTHSSEFLVLAEESIGWLESNPNRNYAGFCWGYPFDWEWLHFVPKGTPSGVVTSVAGEAFLSFYHHSHNEKYLRICRSICEFFLNDLNIDSIDPDRICFSYTPIDQSHVLNANLFVADFLVRVGKATNNSRYVKYGLNALNYTLREQNENGSFYYFGTKDIRLYQLPLEIARKIDHYHTGFVLRSLYNIYQTTKDKQLLCSIDRCLSHYLRALFEDKTIPKFMPEFTYPINIHGCAEAILCLSTLIEEFPHVRETLEKTTLWTINEMQTNNGWFIYMMKERMGLKWKIRIPFIRWGQAWMLRALSNYYMLLNKI